MSSIVCFIEHNEVPEARGKYGCSFKQNTIGLTKDEGNETNKISLGELSSLSKGTSSNNYTVQLWVLLVLQ